MPFFRERNKEPIGSKYTDQGGRVKAFLNRSVPIGVLDEIRGNGLALPYGFLQAPVIWVLDSGIRNPFEKRRLPSEVL
jgi:hypothetical protein